MVVRGRGVSEERPYRPIVQLSAFLQRLTASSGMGPQGGQCGANCMHDRQMQQASSMRNCQDIVYNVMDGENALADLSDKVARLAEPPSPRGMNGMHWLQRLSEQTKLRWPARSTSRQFFSVKSREPRTLADEHLD